MNLKNIRRLLQNPGIRYKLIINFVMVISVPLFTLGLIGSSIYSRTIESEVTNHTLQMIDQVNLSVENYIDRVGKVIELTAAQPEIIRFMKLDSMYDINRVNIETEARNRMAIIKDTYPEIAGLLVANENDLYISNELYRKSRTPLKKDAWYQMSIANPTTFQLANKPINRNLSTSLNYSANDIVSVSKAFFDPLTLQVTGVILIDVRIDTIKQIIESVKLGKSGFVYMADQNGDVIYTVANDVVYRINDLWLSSDASKQLIKPIKGINYQILFSRSDFTQWKTVGVFSLDEALNEVKVLRYFTLVIALATFFLSFLISVYFASSIVRPINTIKELMKKVENGNLSVQFRSDQNDELSQLGQGFNHMLSEIKNLIEQVYREQKSKREAELRILQAQIKPHFLYNTLDNIKWMAQEHKAQDIVDVVAALTKLFRHTISKGEEIIKVKEEIEHITSYLYIQKVRYEEKLNYSIDIDADTLELFMVRLSLQPLVENAIYHGIKQKRGSGNVRLTGKIQDQTLLFTVYDDGIGIEPEKVQELNAMLDDRKLTHGRSGYGIYNVNERIKMTFGDQYGLKYASEPGEWTCVEARYPIVKEIA
jgi:two-component system sensor histidine kinase YesM